MLLRNLFKSSWKSGGVNGYQANPFVCACVLLAVDMKICLSVAKNINFDNNF